MTENICTPLDPKLIQGLSSDEVDEIFLTRMLWGYQVCEYFYLLHIVKDFLHYPGLDTMEKVYDKAYFTIQKLLEQGYITCINRYGELLSCYELANYKATIYRIMDLTYRGGGVYSPELRLTPKAHDFVALNYPKHQTLIEAIYRLERVGRYAEDTINTCTPLDPELVQGLSSDEIDNIFFTRMLWAFEILPSFELEYFVENFLHYPGLDTMEKVYDKTYFAIQKILDEGFATFTNRNDTIITFTDLNRYKAEVYKALDGTAIGIDSSYYRFKLTKEAPDYVAHHYPKYQSIIKEIDRLERERLNAEDAINTCTPLGEKFIQGLSSDEVDDIFLTHMLRIYVDWPDFNPTDMEGDFDHYPGLDTMEKLHDKVYFMLQKVLEEGYATCTTFDGDPVTFTDLNKHKAEVYKLIDGTYRGIERYYYLFDPTPKAHEFVTRNYPKYQTIIDEIQRLGETANSDLKQSMVTELQREAKQLKF